MAEFSHYSWSCDRNSVCWLVYDIDLTHCWELVKSQGLYGSWLMPYIFLFKVSVNICDLLLFKPLPSFFLFGYGSLQLGFLLCLFAYLLSHLKSLQQNYWVISQIFSGWPRSEAWRSPQYISRYC